MKLLTKENLLLPTVESIVFKSRWLRAFVDWWYRHLS